MERGELSIGSGERGRKKSGGEGWCGVVCTMTGGVRWVSVVGCFSAVSRHVRGWEG